MRLKYYLLATAALFTFGVSWGIISRQRVVDTVVVDVVQQRHATVRKVVDFTTSFVPFDPKSERMRNTPAVVISHYSEDLTWISELGPNTNIFVMHKSHNQSTPQPSSRSSSSEVIRRIAKMDPEDGDSILDALTNQSLFDKSWVDVATLVVPPTSTVTVKRVSNEDGWGRECSGYLAWIVDNYDNLPPRVAFLQGNPIVSTGTSVDGHAHEVDRRWSHVRRTLHSKPASPRDSYTFVDWRPPVFQRCVNESHWLCCALHGDDVAFAKSVGLDLAAMQQGRYHASTASCAGADIMLTSTTGAQFIVTRDALRFLTRQQWSRVLKFAVSRTNYPNRQNLATSKHAWPMTNCHSIEHLWHVLMGRLPNHVECPNSYFSDAGSAAWAGCRLAPKVLQSEL